MANKVNGSGGKPCSAALGVYTVDDEMWFIAESEDEAIHLAKSVCDIAADDIGVCRRLTVEELEATEYFDDIYDRTGKRTEQSGLGYMQGRGAS